MSDGCCPSFCSILSSFHFRVLFHLRKYAPKFTVLSTVLIFVSPVYLVRLPCWKSLFGDGFSEMAGWYWWAEFDCTMRRSRRTLKRKENLWWHWPPKWEQLCTPTLTTLWRLSIGLMRSFLSWYVYLCRSFRIGISPYPKIEIFLAYSKCFVEELGFWWVFLIS